MTNQFKLHHSSALDGLRGVAVLSVFATHSKLLIGGYYGVDMFFTLSGFLITCILLQEFQRKQRVNLKQFYLRRALRLLPALAALSIACLIYETIYRQFNPERHVIINIFYAFSYLSNWVNAFLAPHDDVLGPMAMAWSLAIEEQFYFMWPLALSLLLKMRVRISSIALLLCIAIVWVILWRLYLWRSEASRWRIYDGADTHADPILIGCLCGVLSFCISSRIWEKFKASSILCSPLLLCSLLIIFNRCGFLGNTIFHIGFTISSAITAGLIVAVILIPTPSVKQLLEWPVLVWFGKISYSLYLWHGTVHTYAERHFPQLNPAWPGAIGLLLATLSFYFIEQPFLRLKERFK